MAQKSRRASKRRQPEPNANDLEHAPQHVDIDKFGRFIFRGVDNEDEDEEEQTLARHERSRHLLSSERTNMPITFATTTSVRNGSLTTIHSLDSSLSYRLERVTLSFFDAVNRRILEPPTTDNYSPWSHTSTGYTFQPAYTFIHTGRGATGVKMGICDTLQLMQKTCEQSPGYRLRILDVRSEVDQRTGRGWVFVNVETTGLPTGIVRQSVVTNEWRRIMGDWKCARVTSIMGIGPD